MNATMLSGGCIEMIPAFDLEEVLKITAAGKVTKLFGVPTVYVRLLSVENLRERLGAGTIASLRRPAWQWNWSESGNNGRGWTFMRPTV